MGNKLIEKTKQNGGDLTISAKKVFSLVPKTLEEAMHLAKLISESDLAPKDFKGKPGNTLIAIQMGAEVGISPMQAIQNIAVINGRPSIYGDMGKALLLEHGCRIEERDMKDVKKSLEGWCRIIRPDGSPPTVRTFSIDNAKDAGLWGKQGPWTTTPYRMLAWRAFWFAARDAAADMLRGLSGAEEVRDYIDTQSAEEALESAIPAPRRASETVVAKDAEIVEPVREIVDPEIGEVVSEPPEDNTEPEIAGTGWKKMRSNFPGSCATCKSAIGKGQSIWYDGKAKKAHHESHFTNA